MTNIVIFFFVAIIIAPVLLGINFILAPHSPYKEKNKPFECGYTSFWGQNRIQFSISFYIYAFLFLLFDTEVTLVYPYLVSSYLNQFAGLIGILGFLLLLVIGFGFELNKKALVIESRQNKKLSDVEDKNEVFSLDLPNVQFINSKSSLHTILSAKKIFS